MAVVRVLDKATLLERLGGDEDILREVAQLYLQEAENYCQNLAAAQASGVAVDLQRVVHTLKGLFATFVDEDGIALALSLEAALKAGRQAEAEAGVPQLQGLVRELAALLRQTYPEL